MVADVGVTYPPRTGQHEVKIFAVRNVGGIVMLRLLLMIFIFGPSKICPIFLNSEITRGRC